MQVAPCSGGPAQRCCAARCHTVGSAAPAASVGAAEPPRSASGWISSCMQIRGIQNSLPSIGALRMLIMCASCTCHQVEKQHEGLWRMWDNSIVRAQNPAICLRKVNRLSCACATACALTTMILIQRSMSMGEKKKESLRFSAIITGAS